MNPMDTTDAAWRAQVAVWRRLGGPATAELALRMSDDARAVSMDGVRARHPEYTEDEVRHAVFRMMLGDDLYRAAWPDRPLLDP